MLYYQTANIKFMKNYFLFVLLFSTYLSYSQDIEFSNCSGNLLYINPAFTGTSRNLRIGVSGAAEYRLKKNKYFATNIYADQYLGKNNGIGISYLYEGYYKWTKETFHINYAYQVPVGKINVLSIGLKGGFVKSDYIHGSNIEADGGIGLLFYNKRIFASYGVSHLTRTIFIKEVYGTAPNHNVFFGGNLNIGNIKISPQIELNLGSWNSSGLALMKIGYKWFSLGAAFRTDESYYGMFGVKIKNVNLNYSYDFSEPKSSPYIINTHEFSVQLLLNTLKNENERAINIL